MNSRELNSTLKARKLIDTAALERRGYRFGKKIGKGSYGSVVLAKYKDPKSDKIIDLACKYIDKSKAPKDFMLRFFPRELDILTTVSHANIIRIHSILQSGSSVFIFMRHAECGDLLDYIKKNGNIPEIQANLWFYQAASAIQYLHNLNIAHRDLKCENILISCHMNIKLADFGFARYTVDENGKDIMSKTHCGSAAYAAPEIIKGHDYSPTKADVWSLGVVLSIMVYGVMPFDDNNMKKLIDDQMHRRYIVSENISDTLSAECKVMIKACLEPDYKDRCDINTLLKFSWLKKQVEKHAQ